VSTPAAAQIQVGEWVGVYDMTHDGHVGTLHIDDTKVDCASPAWCALRLSYVDANDTRIPAAVRGLDQDGQHMVFDILFPGNRQRFQAYLMSWDKTKMAGTTVWNGRTFGFYGAKRPAVRPIVMTGRLQAAPARGRGTAVLTPVQPSTSPAASGALTPPAAGGQSTIRPDGQVETLLPDGRRKLSRPGQCGWTIINTDGSEQVLSCSTQVPPANPPLPQGASATWLNGHNESLLNVIRGLLGNDQTSVSNYLAASEPPASTVYDRIRLRTSLIALLTSP
jgi:hypothetical protein